MPHINRWHLLSDISHLMKTLHSVLPIRRWGNKILQSWQDHFLNFWLVGEKQMGRGVMIWNFLNGCEWQPLKKGTWFVLFAIFIKVILVLDIFAYTKRCIKFALPKCPYTFRFQLEWGFLNHIEFKFRWKWIDLFVYNSGAKCGK